MKKNEVVTVGVICNDRRYCDSCLLLLAEDKDGER
jgi:hypothetical protein